MGVDALGYYLPPFAYAYMQVLQQAIESAKSLDDDKFADALRKIRSTPLSATSNSVRMGNGPSHACSRCSSRT